MIVVMKKNATGLQIKKVIQKIKESGMKPHVSKGEILTRRCTPRSALQ